MAKGARTLRSTPDSTLSGRWVRRRAAEKSASASETQRPEFAARSRIGQDRLCQAEQWQADLCKLSEETLYTKSVEGHLLDTNYAAPNQAICCGEVTDTTGLGISDSIDWRGQSSAGEFQRLSIWDAERGSPFVPTDNAGSCSVFKDRGNTGYFR